MTTASPKKPGFRHRFTRRHARPVPLVLGLALCAGTVHAASFDFGDVVVEAKKLADSSYQPPDTTLPKELADLSYDQYRDIRFRPDHNRWRKEHLPFEMAFFHRGHFFQEAVHIYEIDGSGSHEIPFNADDFDYGHNHLDTSQLKGLGFAGMRLHYPLNSPNYKDEVLVFLGGSYFRALGANQRYGSSARALAIDTGQDSGEEFPRFRKLWIEKPKADAHSITLYALLDTPRATGAYRFVLTPGKDTVMGVQAELFLRHSVTTLGLAPLTSMFFFGSNQRPDHDDYRPEVHDADGLSLHTGNGEWLWRPLVNPKHLLISSFTDTDPQGFGLMQRQRDPGHFEDPEAHYEMRPSVWVEPDGKWGAGRVELVEIPEPDETHDNIVAYWVPAQQPAPGQAYHLAYKLHWQREQTTLPPQSWVTQTRRGVGFQKNPDGSIGLIVDFKGPALAALPPERKVDAVVSADSNAQLLETTAYPNDIGGGTRLSLRLRRLDDNKPVELRAFLRSGNDTVSETWSYLLPPN